ncbi:hypothetical protein T8T21_17375 (plasmid) [Limimaricola variabilis]|uniref:hypothetical protein n=1 Tax=Limimaricola variabilis TaxID=1492771 RepID=UPI002AC95F4C|nr:hypothetical protein [Limimaricola variabilis]WPY96524.1 hypothetical protein T8T21_17375 [Limimaricola variabilis]
MLELARKFLNLILKLLGLPLVAARKTARALGLGGSRGGGHDAAAEQARRQQEFDAPSAVTQPPAAVSGSPSRLIPAMKAYLQAPTDHQRTEIAKRLRHPQIIAYLDGLRPEERDAFLEASPGALRGHFDGKLPHARLPAWSTDFDYSVIERPGPKKAAKAAPVAPAKRQPLRSSTPPSGAATATGLRSRTARMVERHRQLAQ